MLRFFARYAVIPLLILSVLASCRDHVSTLMTDADITSLA
jgi:hypothetical protein